MNLTKEGCISGAIGSTPVIANSETFGTVLSLLSHAVMRGTIDPKGDHAGLRLPSLVPLRVTASCSASRQLEATTAKIKPDSSIARLSSNSGSPCST